jgi:bile acid:Na+ symporter, BASS family
MEYSLIDILVSCATGLIMFGIGISISISDFKNIFVWPKALTVSLVSQMFALPIIAFVIAYFAPISPAFKVGLVILAASPGGATSGFITYLLRGHIALSVSLTSINSFLTLISIPLVVNLALKFFMGEHKEIELPILDSILQIFLITILPTLAGIAFRYFNEKLSIRIDKILKFVMIFLLLIVFLIKAFANQENGGVSFVKSDFYNIIPYALLLNFSCLLFGYFFLWVFGLPHHSRITASIESGVHNTPLAILIAGTLLANQEMVKPILLYALFSFWTSFIFGYFLNVVNDKIFKNFSKSAKNYAD